MYDLLDRRVADLPRFERDMLMSTRRWVHALTLAGHAPEQAADDGFHAAMHALDRGSRDDLVIQRPCFATVEDTEALILSLWRLVRDGRFGAAHAVAASLVDASSARAMIAAMDRAIAAA